VYPAEFEYFSPRTVDEALELLARHGDAAKILAGGQSLLPMMKLRIASPSYLVDVNGIDFGHGKGRLGGFHGEIGCLFTGRRDMALSYPRA